MLDRLHADFRGLLTLVANVNLAGRVFAHQHHGQPWLDAVSGLERLDLLCDHCADVGCYGLAVDDLWVRHSCLPSRLSVSWNDLFRRFYRTKVSFPTEDLSRLGFAPYLATCVRRHGKSAGAGRAARWSRGLGSTWSQSGLKLLKTT